MVLTEALGTPSLCSAYRTREACFVEASCRKLILVLRNQRRRQTAAQRIFHDLVNLAGHIRARRLPTAHAFADVAIERFQVEIQLAEVFRLKLTHLQLNRDQAVETAVEEEQIQRESRPPTCNGYSEPVEQKSRPNSISKPRRFSRSARCRSASA